MKKTFSLLLTLLAVFALTVGCKKPVENNQEEQNQEQNQEEEKEEEEGQGEKPKPEDLADLKLTVVTGAEDNIFSHKPVYVMKVENPNSVEVEAKILSRIVSDTKKTVATIERTEKIPANSTKDIEITTEDVLAPGFYRSNSFVDGKANAAFYFGVDPFQIVSAPDKQPDFDQFWEAAKAQLPAIDPNAVYMAEITSKSNASCKVYFVELESVPDGPEGAPVLIHGYYLEPQDGKPHPVLMHFFGYDTLGSTAKVSCPSGDGQYAEFYLSHRGQYLNRTTADKREPDGKGDFENTYGDWFAFNFGNKDGYYYRGAFMDCVQAVNFMATRSTSDMNNLFAEGSSQGGALSYACAALSDYPFTAIAPCVAFLGDYPDYFQITSWPADVAKNSAKAAGLSDEDMYKFLSYFDTKNLATRIPASTAVLACSGLKDSTCPPHTNIAPFNNLATTDKAYYFYPKMQHEIPGDWPSKTSKFFKERIK